MSKEPFEYGGYHFIPERQLKGAEAGFYAISKKLCEDRELGFCEEGYVYPSKFPYSHGAFMRASTDKECDLYRCVENGKLYIPCNYDLQIYQERPQKTFVVTITETLQMQVEVEAESQKDAERIVSDAWNKSEYILDAEHFKGVEFSAEAITKNRERSER